MKRKARRYRANALCYTFHHDNSLPASSVPRSQDTCQVWRFHCRRASRESTREADFGILINSKCTLAFVSPVSLQGDSGENTNSCQRSLVTLVILSLLLICTLSHSLGGPLQVRTRCNDTNKFLFILLYETFFLSAPSSSTTQTWLSSKQQSLGCCTLAEPESSNFSTIFPPRCFQKGKLVRCFISHSL